MLIVRPAAPRPRYAPRRVRHIRPRARPGLSSLRVASSEPRARQGSPARGPAGRLRRRRALSLLLMEGEVARGLDLRTGRRQRRPLLLGELAGAQELLVP